MEVALNVAQNTWLYPQDEIQPIPSSYTLMEEPTQPVIPALEGSRREALFKENQEGVMFVIYNTYCTYWYMFGEHYKELYLDGKCWYISFMGMKKEMERTTTETEHSYLFRVSSHS